jgi:hypothetical protein
MGIPFGIVEPVALRAAALAAARLGLVEMSDWTKSSWDIGMTFHGIGGGGTLGAFTGGVTLVSVVVVTWCLGADLIAFAAAAWEGRSPCTLMVVSVPTFPVGSESGSRPSRISIQISSATSAAEMAKLVARLPSVGRFA